MDLVGYDSYLSGKLHDYELPENEMLKYTKELDKFPPAAMRKTGRW
jgi:hypothetical protein